MIEPRYQSDRVTLYCADCLDVLPQLEAGSVDAVVTDPPYGLNYSTGWLPETIPGDEYSISGKGDIDGDADIKLRNFISDWAHDNNLPCAMFGTWKVTRPPHIRSLLIWDKGPASGMGDLSFPWKPSFEEIYIMGDGWYGKRDEGVIRVDNINRVSNGRTHPMMKPPVLIKKILEKLSPEIIILDPFMGSGTTGVAAMQLGRRFIGIEIDEKYYAIAEKRIKAAESQLLLGI